MSMPKNTPRGKQNELTQFSSQTSRYVESFRNNITRSPYYKNHEELITTDTIVSSLYRATVDVLLPDGFAWMNNGKFELPSDQFSRIANTYWKNFIAHAIRFHMCYGFLIWTAVTDRSGVMYPSVPEMSLLSTDFYEDDKTGMSNIRASWKNKSVKSALYVIYTGFNVYGSTNQAPMSIINSILPYIDFLYRTTIDRMSIGHHLAEPPFIIVHNNAISGAAGMSNSGVANALAGGGPIENVANMRHAIVQAQSLEDNARERYKVAQMDRTNTPANQGFRVMGPSERMNYSINQPYEKQAHIMSLGLEPFPVPLPSTDLNFIPTSVYLEQKIFDAFGFTRDYHMREATFKQWASTCHEWLTSVYRILYNQGAITVGEMKPTYADDKRRWIETDEDFGHVEFFVDPDETNYLGNNVEYVTNGYLMCHAKRDIGLAGKLKNDGIIGEDELFILFPSLREKYREDAEAEAEKELENELYAKVYDEEGMRVGQKRIEYSSDAQQQSTTNLNKRVKVMK